MATKSISAKRTSPTKHNMNGIKALIMAGSLGITLGGWGILATQQTASATASTQPAQVASSSTQPASSISSSLPIRPLARTRSSH